MCMSLQDLQLYILTSIKDEQGGLDHRLVPITRPGNQKNKKLGHGATFFLIWGNGLVWDPSNGSCWEQGTF